MRPWFLALLVLAACRGGDKGNDGEIGYGEDDTVDADGDGYDSLEDCDDADPLVNPGAAEDCNGEDDDCDGEIDEGVTSTWYGDGDGDGHGDPDQALEDCAQPEGSAESADDCDDDDASVYPGAPEACDGVDDDCDGEVDEEVVGIWYQDADGDGFGDPDTAYEGCDPPDSYVADATDCDDLDPASNPDAAEVCDEADNDCDGTIDEGVTTTYYLDGDGDGYGDGLSTTEACSQPEGHVADGTDCDDGDAAVSPAAQEVCNGLDDDCDGLVDDDDSDVSGGETWYADTDADGHGDASSTTEACEEPLGFVADDTDCDDDEATVSPSASETCNEVDDDCDGSVDEEATDAATWYGDSDGDGYGGTTFTQEACDQPTDYVDNADDCDDLDEDINPAADEICNEVDDDCDGDIDDDDASLTDPDTWYADSDGDGFGDSFTTAESCEAPSAYVADQTDCDDTDDTVNPDATDGCNGVDDDCDGSIDEETWDESMMITLIDGELNSLDTTASTWTILYEVDDSAVGSYSHNAIAGPWDDTTAYLQASVGGSFELLELDTCDGTLTSFGAHGAGNTCGLAFANDGTLYGVDTTNDELVTLDPATGLATSVGGVGFNIQNCGMTYDCTNDVLYAMHVNTSTNVGEIYEVDTATGAATSVLTLDSSVTWTGAGIQYDPVDLVFYAVTGSGLYEIDPSTGAASQLWSDAANNLGVVGDLCP